MLTAGGVLTACLGAMGFHHFTLHLRQVLEEHMHCIVQEPASGRAWPWGAAFASLFASAYGACVLMVLTVSISLEDHTLIHGGCALLFFLCLIYHLFAVHFLLWKGSAALARAGRDPHALHAPHGLRLRHCCSAAYVSIKAVQIGGSEFRGWRKERPETSMLTPPNIPGMPPDETLGGGPGAGDPMRMVDLEELSKQIREDLRDHE